MNFILFELYTIQSNTKCVLPNVDMEVASIHTFNNLFNRSEQEVLRLAKYIYNAFIIRENMLKSIPDT